LNAEPVPLDSPLPGDEPLPLDDTDGEPVPLGISVGDAKEVG